MKTSNVTVKVIRKDCCVFNPGGVDCKIPETYGYATQPNECNWCGWNPEVSKERIKDLRKKRERWRRRWQP